MVVPSRMAARSAMWRRSTPAAAIARTTRARPALNQPAATIIGKIEDQNAGSSDKIQSIDAKLADKARAISPIALIQDRAGAIGVAAPRGVHKANAAIRHQSATSIA